MEPDQSIPTNVSCPQRVHCYLLKLCVEKDAARRCGAVDEGNDTSFLRVVYLIRHVAPYLITVRVGSRIARCARVGRLDMKITRLLAMKDSRRTGMLGEVQFMKRMVNEISDSSVL